MMSLDIWLSIDIDTGGKDLYQIELYWANITHNLVPMWDKAGVYDALYNSDYKQAREIVDQLKAGVIGMEEKPNEYIALNPSNEWGSYDDALPWLRKFLAACE